MLLCRWFRAVFSSSEKVEGILAEWLVWPCGHSGSDSSLALWLIHNHRWLDRTFEHSG